MTVDFPARWLAAVVLAASIPACSNLQLRGPQSTVPEREPSPSIVTRPAVASSGVRNAEVRRVCRGSSPGGWIAIDYVADSTTCARPATQQTRYSAALIVSYRDARVGDMLEVCADERVPGGWVKDRKVGDDPRCPNDRASSEPTVMVIRRVR